MRASDVDVIIFGSAIGDREDSARRVWNCIRDLFSGLGKIFQFVGDLLIGLFAIEIGRENSFDFWEVACGAHGFHFDRSGAGVDNFKVGFLSGFLGDILTAQSNPLPFIAGLDVLAGAAEKKPVEDLHKVAVNREADFGCPSHIKVNTIAVNCESGRAKNTM